jgi:GTP pyrophosphokinase
MSTSIDEIVQRVSGYWPGVDRENLVHAYDYAFRAHAGQERLSHEPYIIHPLEVSSILSQIESDPPAITAGLLHDVIEDSEITVDDVRGEFGNTVASLVDGVTKLGRLDFYTKQEEQARNLRKMFLAMAEDIRVIVIKLGDRLHNMRTLDYMPRDKQQLKAEETLNIFAPLSHRLGIWRFKWELEDLSLKFLEPEAYSEVARLVGVTREERERDIETARLMLVAKLEEAGVKAEVRGRAKHIYSIRQKMVQQGLNFDQIRDLAGLRVIVSDIGDCYAALGVVHGLWMPLTGEFSDYIAKPKANQYQSLHTKVLGPSGQPLEVQIRTREMHRTAEYGVAAHWRYKEGGQSDPGLDERIGWLRQLLELETDLSEGHEFIEALKIDLVTQEVFVWTPAGDVMELPAGSGPIDFAYRIHTEVGNHCIGAKVNGKLVPLTYKFKTGDIVEILTSPTAKPSRDWLNVIESSSAKAKVRKYLRERAREENIEAGHRELERHLERLRADQRAAIKPDHLESVARHLNYTDVNSLLAAIGYGVVEPDTVVDHLLAATYKPPSTLAEELERLLPGISASRATRAKPLSIAAAGVNGVHSRLSKCCNPLPGDVIVGYITRGGGLAVHRADCKNVLYRARGEPERVVALTWGEESQETTYQTELEIVALDRVGLIAHVTAVVAEMGINISEAAIDTIEQNLARLRFMVDIHRREDLQHLVDRLSQLIDVMSVRVLPGAR